MRASAHLGSAAIAYLRQYEAHQLKERVRA